MDRTDLVPDCGRCAALCCVATSFDASEDFAFDKAAGVRCPHLTRDDRCAIHASLAVRGFRGCAVYGCHGAGQRVTSAFASAPDDERHEAFRVLRVVHELLWLLTEATKICPLEVEVTEALRAQTDALDAIARSTDRALLELDVGALLATTHLLLRRVGQVVGGRRARSLDVYHPGRMAGTRGSE